MKVHPVLEDWNGVGYELFYDKEGKIEILGWKKKCLSKSTKDYLKKNPKPDELVIVNKKKFLKAIQDFIKKNEGKKYHLLDFSNNSIGFKNYVIDKSKVK